VTVPGFFDLGVTAEDNELSPEQRDALVEKIARAVVDRNLTAPAVFFLESVKPLSFIGSQVMVFFDPIVRSVFTLRGYNEVRLAMEDRQNVEILLRRIEALDAEKRGAARKRRRPDGNG